MQNNRPIDRKSSKAATRETTRRIECFSCGGNHRRRDCDKPGGRRPTSGHAPSRSWNRDSNRERKEWESKHGNGERTTRDDASRANRTGYGLRPDPKPNGKYEQPGRNTTSQGQGLKTIVNEEKEAQQQLGDGLVRLGAGVTAPYRLDTGAVRSILPRPFLLDLQTREALSMRHLKKPVYFELGDGRKVAVREIAHLTVELETAEGPVKLRDVAFRVLPQG